MPKTLAVKDGDVVVPVKSNDYYWDSGVACRMLSTQGVLIWTRCPAGWIDAVAMMGELDTSKYRLANPEERRQILVAMKGIPFMDPEKKYVDPVYWMPVYERVLKPLIDSV